VFSKICCFGGKKQHNRAYKTALAAKKLITFLLNLSFFYETNNILLCLGCTEVCPSKGACPIKKMRANLFA
jgi:hypothetical protein